jgi:hypothetical protein
VACLDDSLIVVGGWGDSRGYLSDVWSSREGKDWTLLCAVIIIDKRLFFKYI